MRLKYGLCLIGLAALAGCASVEFVRKDTKPAKQAVVRYPPVSSQQDTKYRADLDKKALEFCGGPYVITKEYQAMDGTGTSAGVGTGFGLGMGAVYLNGSSRRDQMFNFIEFSCQL